MKEQFLEQYILYYTPRLAMNTLMTKSKLPSNLFSPHNPHEAATDCNMNRKKGDPGEELVTTLKFLYSLCAVRYLF